MQVLLIGHIKEFGLYLQNSWKSLTYFKHEERQDQVWVLKKITVTVKAKNGMWVVQLAGYGGSLCRDDEMIASWTRVVAVEMETSGCIQSKNDWLLYWFKCGQ